MERVSVVEYLDNFLRRGRECAYVQPAGYRSQRWSYRQVAETAFQFARELEKRGIGKGERVLLWGPNSAEWIAAFFGCALRGVVVVPLDDAGAADFTRRVFRQVDGKLLLCASGRVPPEIPVLVFEELRQTLSAHSPAPYPAAATGPADILEIVFTSGTTSAPKGVVITHGNVLGNIAPLETEIRKYLKYERLVHPIHFLNLLPLSHVFGQFLGMFLPQLMGGTVIFSHSLNAGEAIRTMQRERVSVLVAVPRMLQSLKEKIERDLEEEGRLDDFRRRLQVAAGKYFLRRWWIFRRVHRRFGWKFWAFISGGAALDRTTEEFWGRLGYAAIQGYGLTETTSIVSVNHPFRLGQGSIGKVLAGREVKLAEDGEIMVRGGGVAAGYWTGSGMQPMTADEGWYNTGDIGALDAAGNLYFKGRKKDVIVTPAGMNVYPEDLEAALRRQPEVKDCVVIALPQGENAEPCAVVILRAGVLDPGPAVHRANESLAEYQRMRHWRLWPEGDFPRTSTQKPKTHAIQQQVLERHGESGEAGARPLAELIARVKGKSGGPAAQASSLETDLNLSSLDRVELLGELEERYQVELSESRFAAIKTVGELERMLQRGLPTRPSYHYPAWVQRWPATWVRLFVHYLLLRPAVFILGWPRVTGRENLDGVSGPALIVCNHIDDVDAVLVQIALPGRFRHRLATATAGEVLESLRAPSKERNLPGRIYDRVKWTLGVLLLNLFPLPRESGFRESFAYAGASVDRGYSILIFPEGRHTIDGSVGRFRAGAGLLANNLAIPVVPLRIDGLFALKQAKRKFARRGTIKVSIGKAMRFPTNSSPEWIAGELRKTVESL